MNKSKIEKTTWNEFHKTGLLRFVNLFLHIFGWCIVIETNDACEVSVYPARCNFNGFSPSDELNFLKLRRFMRNDTHFFKLNCGEKDDG